jgi:hypothetical protein
MIAASELECLSQRGQVILGTILADLVFEFVIQLEYGVYRRRGRFGNAS